MPRAPGRRRPGSGRCRGRPARPGVRPRARNASTSSSRTSARMSSSSSTAILLISCEVRKPSKKCRNGIRARSVAACATSAKSCASWTEPAASIAQPGRAGVHHVAVVAEDREGVRRDRPGRDVDDRRRQLAGDLEHVGDHQEQALRRRERRRQGTLLERAVEGARRARLGLHLDDVRDLAPQVRPAGSGPVVAVLGHRRGRRDRVDRDHLADGVGDRGPPPRCRPGTRSAGPRAGLPSGIGW